MIESIIRQRDQSNQHEQVGEPVGKPLNFFQRRNTQKISLTVIAASMLTSLQATIVVSKGTVVLLSHPAALNTAVTVSNSSQYGDWSEPCWAQAHT